MLTLLTIFAVIALVGWVADQTLRDVQGIRRTSRRRHRERASSGFEQEDESPFVGLLRVEAA